MKRGVDRTIWRAPEAIVSTLGNLTGEAVRFEKLWITWLTLFSLPRILDLLSDGSIRANNFGFPAYNWEPIMAALFLTSAKAG
jgi:hypothetical protein